MAEHTAIQKSGPEQIEVTGNRTNSRAWTYRPNVDIFDNAEELLLIADLPGADPSSIDVALESGVLTIDARAAQMELPQSGFIAHEYGVGNYHRRFEIDEFIDSEAVTADYRNGSLTVHLPKAQQARRRRIPVSA